MGIVRADVCRRKSGHGGSICNLKHDQGQYYSTLIR